MSELNNQGSNKIASKKPLAPEVARASSFTLAPCIMECLSDVGSSGAFLRSDLKTSWRLVPLVVPEKWRFFLAPTTAAILMLSPGTTVTVSICGKVKTSVIVIVNKLSLTFQN